MRISLLLFSLLFQFSACLFGQQAYQLDFLSFSIDPPISFDTLGGGEIILAHQIYDDRIGKESSVLSYLTAQPDTFWTRKFPDFRVQEVRKDVNGFIMAGNGLIKLDVQGITNWAYSYGRHIDALELDGQQGYLIGGGNYLARVNTNGSLIWMKDLPLFIDKIIQTKNGNFAAAALSTSGQAHPTLLLFDINGSIIQARQYIDGNSSPNGFANDLVQGPDSSIYMACNITSSAFIYEPGIIKTSSSGEVIWLAKGGLVSGNHKLLYSISIDKQDNLYLCGRGGTYMGGANGQIPYIAKINPSGRLIDAKEVLYAGSVKQLIVSDNKLWAAGSYDIEFSGKEYLALFDTSLTYCSPTPSSSINGFLKSSRVQQNDLNLSPTNQTRTAVPLNFFRNLSVPFSVNCSNCIDTAIAAFTYQVNGNTINFQDSSSHALEWFWDFGDGNSTNDRNPSHSYNSHGAYEVCLSVGNACGTASFCDSVELWRTSRTEQLSDVLIQLSPNPAQSYLNIDLKSATFDIRKILIRSIEGKILVSSAYRVQNEIQMDISSYSSGIYLLEIQSSNGNKHLQKFIIDSR